MVRVAICFSGQPRYLEETLNNFKEKFLEPNKKHQVDIFAHFWWEDNYVGDVISRGSNVCYTKNMRDYFIKEYNPINIECSPYMKVDFPQDYEKKQHCKNMPYKDVQLCYYNGKSMFYSIKKSLQLAFEHANKENKEYDLYIRVRSDVIYDNHLNFENFIDDYLYVIDGRHAGADRLLSDTFAMGNRENIEKYSKIYDLVPKYYDNGLIHMHELLYNCLANDFKCRIRLFKFTDTHQGGWSLVRPQNHTFFYEQIDGKKASPKYMSFYSNSFSKKN